MQTVVLYREELKSNTSKNKAGEKMDMKNWNEEEFKELNGRTMALKDIWKILDEEGNKGNGYFVYVEPDIPDVDYENSTERHTVEHENDRTIVKEMMEGAIVLSFVHEEYTTF